MNEKKMNKGIVMGFVLLIVLSAISMVVVTSDVVIALPYSETGFDGGDGSPLNPYEISNWTHLHNVRNNLTENFILTSNLNSTTSDYADYNSVPAGWTPIGNLSDMFTGIFEGDGYIIEDLFINRSNEEQIGLFGVMNNADIYNLRVLNANVTGGNNTGILAGDIIDTYIDNCYVSGDVSGANQTGGFAGYVSLFSYVYDSASNTDVTGTNNTGGFVGLVTSDAFIDLCIFEGNVTGKDNVGGFAGYGYGSGWFTMIIKCEANAVVIGETNVGGFVGIAGSYLDASYSYSSGTVSGDVSVGGYVGNASSLAWIVNAYTHSNVTRLTGSSDEGIGGFAGTVGDFVITESYSTGSVHYEGVADPTDKGFAGVVYGVNAISFSFWDNQTSGQTSSAGEGVDEVEGRNTTEMQLFTTFNDAGWDIIEISDWQFDRDDRFIWNIENETTYPFLSWERVTGVYPTIITLDPINVGDTTATLRTYVDLGTVDNCTVRFWYYEIPDGDVNWTDPIEVTSQTGIYTADIENLTADTWYSYEAMITYPEPGYEGGSILFLTGVIFPGGNGTASNPYHITNWHHLYNVRNYLNRSFIQMANLTEDTEGYVDYNSGDGWASIGTGGLGFEGLYYGNGYIISDLTINRIGENYLGLFSVIETDGVLVHVIMEDVDIYGGYDYIGAITAMNLGNIIACSSSGTIVGDHPAEVYTVGGLVGLNLDGGRIHGSFSTVDVTADRYVGGLVGVNLKAILGHNYAHGNVTGSFHVGGYVGMNHNGYIGYSYSKGAVTGIDDVGGFAGSIFNTTAEFEDVRNFWDNETSGQVNSTMATGLDTATMLSINPYDDVNWSIQAILELNDMPNIQLDEDLEEEDLEDITIWYIIEEETYPMLFWQSTESLLAMYPEVSYTPPVEEDDDDDDDDTTTPTGATNVAVRILLAFIPIVVVIFVIGKIIIPMLGEVGDDIEQT